MNFDLILGGSILLLIAGLLMLRTRAGFMTLGLCAGYVLAGTLNENIFHASQKVPVSVSGISTQQILQIVVTLLPAIVVGLHFYKSQRGLSLLQQLSPTVGVVGLLVVFIQPILERSSLEVTLANSPLWSLFTNYRTYIVIYAISVSMVGILLDGKGHKPKRGRPKKHE